MNSTLQKSIFHTSRNMICMVLTFIMLVAPMLTHAQECMLVCPNVPTVTSTTNSCGAMVQGVDAVTSGSCMSTPASQSGFFPVGDTEVTFSTTDAAGQPVSCTTVVTVVDNTNPVIDDCQDVFVDLAAGDCGQTFALPFAAISDNCGDMDASISLADDSSVVEQGYVCPSGPTSYFTVYNAEELNLFTGLDISSVDFRVFQSVNDAPVTVNIYDLEGDIITGDLTVIGTGTAIIPNVQNEFVSVPVTANIPSTSNFVVEIVAPGSQFNGPVVGLNDLGHDGQTFVSSASCGVAVPTPIATTNFPGFGVVMMINGVRPDLDVVQLDNTGISVGDMLTEGIYNFEFALIDASGNTSNSCSFTYEVQGFNGLVPAIACNNEIQVSLDEECQIVVTPEMLLEGSDDLCEMDYTVDIEDQNGVSYGNTLTTFNIGQTLKARVTGPQGNSCWGNIVLEDKAPPVLTCEDVYTTCSGDIEPGAAIPSDVTYRADLNQITENLPDDEAVSRNIMIDVTGLQGGLVTDVAVRLDISHEAISDLTASVTSPDGTTKMLFMQPGTFCEEDNLFVTIDGTATMTAADLAATCNSEEDFAAEGSFQPTEPLTDFAGIEPQGIWTITISDVVIGNGGTVNNVELIIRQEGATIAFPTTEDITFIPMSDNSFRVEGVDACGPAILSYNDSMDSLGCDSSFDRIIRRTWNAVDLNGNESEACVQNIFVYRNGLEGLEFPRNYDGIDLPALSCDLYGDNVPGVDVTGNIGGELCDIVQVFPPVDTRLDICANSYKILRQFKVIQWCSGEVVEFTQVIKVLDDEGPELEDVNDITVSTGENDCALDYNVPLPTVLYDCSDEFTYSVTSLAAITAGPPPADAIFSDEGVVGSGENFTIRGLNFGNTWVRVRVIDECGNFSEVTYTVTVEDETSPVAVCDEFTIVSVGGDGRILVDAETFDDGSHDNCGIMRFEAAKMTDVCNSGSTAFRDQVEFCCAEIGPDPIMVQFRVTDNFGNSNTCMVEVRVQDKLPPFITFCPDDITLDCQADFEDLELTGEAEAVDNCDDFSLSFNDSGDIDNCGEGTITRTWTVTDMAGLKNSCTQVIVLMNERPFRESDIDWPDDYDANTCDTNLDPENLPEANAFPRYDEGVCSLVATTYKDQVFSFVDGACEKILRTWTVIDWCTYDELNTSSTDGLYTYSQVIKLVNENPPIIENCNDITVETFGDCEGNVQFTLLATDDCTPVEEITFNYTINLFGDDVPDPLQSGNSATINTTLPNGVHEVEYRVSDKCGNVEVCRFDLTVRDGKKPTPYCRATVVTAVMNNNGEVAIWAKDFNIGSFDNCTEEEDLIYSFSTNVLDTFVVLTCADIPDGEAAIVEMRMYVTDEAGNQDFCDITINVQDNESNICEPEDGGNIGISGTLETDYNKTLSGVRVRVSDVNSGEPVKEVFTNNSGKYNAYGIPQFGNYVVEAYKNDDTRNGVNTLDLVKIQRHILGLEVLSNPYDLIASDINNDERIKASDLLALRKVILGLNSEFSNGQTSWRFVPASSNFENNSDPFPYSDVITIQNLQYSSNYEDMVAVKIGDIDNSVNTLQDGNGEIESRSKEQFTLLVDNEELTSGSTIEVPVYANQSSLSGYQFTLETANLTYAGVIAGQLNVSEEHIGVFDGKITTSWNSAAGVDVYGDQALFTLIFDVDSDTDVELALEINSDITEAIAFDLSGETMDVVIESRSEETKFEEFTVFQNKPNPFTSSTSIDFYLPTPQDVRLNVYDVTGKIIFSRSQYFREGVRTFTLENDDLLTTGVLYYEISAGPHTATMKMVSVK